LRRDIATVASGDQPEHRGGTMFELRLQDAHAARAGSVEGLPLGRFTTYDRAIHELEVRHSRLAAQLSANREGATELRLLTAVVKIDRARETGWLWSSYQPGAENS
jgi:hypothetical protein